MIAELLRKEIKKSCKSRYQIFKDTGIGQDVLCRFMQGSGCNCETIDILLEYFNLEIRPKKKSKR